MPKNRQHSFKILFLVGLTFCFSVNFLSGLPSSAISPSSSTSSYSETVSLVTANSTQAIELGKTYYVAGQYSKAIAIWLKAIALASDANERASIYSNLALAYYQLGQIDKGISQWEEAIKIYQVKKDREANARLAEALIDQGQAYNALGQALKAIERLRLAIEIVGKNKNRNVETVAWGALGNAYFLSKEYDRALKAYSQSLQFATDTKNRDYIITALNNQAFLLNTLAKQNFNRAAVAEQQGGREEEAARLTNLAQENFRSALEKANLAVRESEGSISISSAKALINLIRLLQQDNQVKQDLVASYQNSTGAILGKLPNSRSKAFLLINLAGTKGLSWESKIKKLETAVNVAVKIGDRRTESFARGYLAYAYEQAKQYEKAIALNQQAQLAAQEVAAFESLYRWQWQAGRIYKATGMNEAAIAAYKQAISSLQSIRGELAAASSDLQFDFRDEVEPVYRQMLALLLERNRQSDIKEALQVANLLKLTELQNYFNDDCLDLRQATFHSNNLELKDRFFISSLVLDNKVYMILQLADGNIKSYPIELSAKQLKTEIEKFRYTLEDNSNDGYKEIARKIYALLLQPMEADLARANPKSLVFINDGVLRNIPMAALHDGKQFLIEKYAIVNTLGFQLSFANFANKLSSKQEALIFGLSVESPPFSALPSVEKETQIVHNIVGGKKFLNQDFTLNKLQVEVEKENYPMIHLATHAEFTGNANSTFLQAFNSRISLPELENILNKTKSPLNLLTLSACQTAAGDNRATLGIAGLGVRNGVRNVLGSLWFVNDTDVVALMENFYSELEKNNTNVEKALRNAQLKLIHGNSETLGHPATWAAFILLRS